MSAIRSATLVVAVLALAACHSHSDSTSSGPVPQKFTASLTGVDIVRSADQQAQAVTGLPAAGSEITVR